MNEAHFMQGKPHDGVALRRDAMVAGHPFPSVALDAAGEEFIIAAPVASGCKTPVAPLRVAWDYCWRWVEPHEPDIFRRWLVETQSPLLDIGDDAGDFRQGSYFTAAFSCVLQTALVDSGGEAKGFIGDGHLG